MVFFSSRIIRSRHRQPPAEKRKTKQPTICRPPPPSPPLECKEQGTPPHGRRACLTPRSGCKFCVSARFGESKSGRRRYRQVGLHLGGRGLDSRNGGHGGSRGACEGENNFVAWIFDLCSQRPLGFCGVVFRRCLGFTCPCRGCGLFKDRGAGRHRSLEDTDLIAFRWVLTRVQHSAQTQQPSAWTSARYACEHFPNRPSRRL